MSYKTSKTALKQVPASNSDTNKKCLGIQKNRAGVEFSLMNEEAPTESHQERSHDGTPVSFFEANVKTRVLLVASGKGGVGKSSVTTNLAVALSKRGNDVAVIDADVWGFSIPRMLGITEPPSVIDDMLIPPSAHGVRSISMGFFAEEDQPVIWRGPMLHKALNQFLTDVAWDEPDFLLIDLPPGTGDTAISLAGFLPDSEMLVVTTPQIAAQSVAQRAAFMAEKVEIEVKGVIENMSWFIGDDGQRYELFGEGGGSALAEKLGVPLVGQIPLVPTLRAGSDNGNPVAVDPSTEIGSIFAEIARVVEEDLKPSKRRHRELKIN